eukprot:13412821-Alexandrium_andersonii.AAC.1
MSARAPRMSRPWRACLRRRGQGCRSRSRQRPSEHALKRFGRSYRQTAKLGCVHAAGRAPVRGSSRRVTRATGSR